MEKYKFIFSNAFWVLKESLKKRRVQGEILRDASLASLVNFLYASNKGTYEYILLLASFLGIIVGIILKEGVGNGRNNN
ncbi:MAG: hypothetical protein EOM50_14985 [Erysipelotrichia bacterium]|nr:hypothetical protein [Erysipelotrichia bacterium]